MKAFIDFLRFEQIWQVLGCAVPGQTITERTRHCCGCVMVKAQTLGLWQHMANKTDFEVQANTVFDYKHCELEEQLSCERCQLSALL